MKSSLNILCQIAVVLSLTSSAFGYDIKFQIVQVHASSSADVLRIKEGITFFAELLKRDCKLDLHAKIETKSALSENTKFNFDGTWEIFNNYNFRYFQKSVYDFTKQNSLRQSNNTVSLFMVKELVGRCGFAIPDIQLTDDESKLKNPDSAINAAIFPWIRNRILIAPPATSDTDCGGSNRVVAHELSHIFIQDNPAHQCEDENTHAMKNCDEYNILATRRAVHQNHSDDDFKGPPKHRPDDGMGSETQYLPAIGNSITPLQCNAIEITLRKMQ